MALEDLWSQPLRYRQGSAIRLCGIDVFHEFEWTTVFADNRSQFGNGQRLAERICADCPNGLVPTLLLTIREDEPERAFEADGRLVVVVNVHKYLETASADPAVSYFANRLGTGVTRLGERSRIADADAIEIQEFLNEHLDEDSLKRWVGGDESRLAQVRSLTPKSDEAGEQSLAVPLHAIDSLSDLDGEVVSALAELCGNATDRDSRLELLRALTNDPPGRRDTGQVIGQRASERLADARKAVGKYNALLRDPDSGETDLQECLEADPWLWGLEYTGIRPKQPLPRGEMDFLLERFDGRHDLLELKSPNDPLFLHEDDGEAPASASRFSLSKPLANALAQIHVYRGTLTKGAGAMHLYGLDQTEDPKAIVVIGRGEAMSDFQVGVLAELNRSLHRVEIVPFDVVGKRAKAILDNVDRYLLSTEGNDSSE